MIQLFLLFTVSVFTTVGAHLLFKKGVMQLGDLNISFPAVFLTILSILQNIWILIGIVLFGISFLIWLFIISKIQLNIAYPIIISVEAVLVSLGSWILFKEYLTIWQISGIAAIILGIFLLLTKS